MLSRILEPEALDHLAPDDPAAQRSRRDLRRVNAFMGARRILARAMARAVADERPRPLRILELGCGDGRLMLEVAKHRGDRWPGARLDLLDRLSLVDDATLAAFAAAGWQARPLVADVMDWAGGDGDERWDVIVTNLFLHHFDGANSPLKPLIGTWVLHRMADVAPTALRNLFGLSNDEAKARYAVWRKQRD